MEFGMNQVLRAGLLLGAAAVLGATHAEAQGLPQGVTQAMVDKGNELFHKEGLCYACHGQDAKGLVGPNLTDDVWIHSKGTYDDIVKQIIAGITKEQSKSGIPMPPKGGATISDDDVKAVAAYVYTLSHK
jgi:mono/diheme cytochrome c family protein